MNTINFHVLSNDAVSLHMTLNGRDQDINKIGIDSLTPLQMACRENRGVIAKILIDRGADISFKGVVNLTPLSILALNDHGAEIARPLIEKGASLTELMDFNVEFIVKNFKFSFIVKDIVNQNLINKKNFLKKFNFDQKRELLKAVCEAAVVFRDLEGSEEEKSFSFYRTVYIDWQKLNSLGYLILASLKSYFRFYLEPIEEREEFNRMGLDFKRFEDLYRERCRTKSEEYKCAILFEKTTAPYVDPTTYPGYQIYDKETIKDYFKGGVKPSPISRRLITFEDLIPDYV
jgi:hypothetical protein